MPSTRRARVSTMDSNSRASTHLTPTVFFFARVDIVRFSPKSKGAYILYCTPVVLARPSEIFEVAIRDSRSISKTLDEQFGADVEKAG